MNAKQARKQSLVSRLAVTTLIFIALSALSSSYLTSYFSKSAYTREETRRMRNLARSTRASLKNIMAADDYTPISSPIDDILRQNTDVSLVVVKEKKGNLVYESDHSLHKRLKLRTSALAPGQDIQTLIFTDPLSEREVKALKLPFRQGKLFFGTFMLFYYPASALEKEREKQFLSLGHSIIASVLELFANFQYFEVAEFTKTIIRGQRDILYCAVVDKQNLAIFHTDLKHSRKTLEDPLTLRAQEAVTLSKPVFIQRTRLNNENVVDISMLLGVGEKLGLVRLGYSLASLRKQEKIENARIFIFAFLLSLSGILFVVFIAKRISLPILSLAKLAVKVGKGELSEKASVPETNDEVSSLVQSFNNMIDGLRERELVKDVFSRYVTKDVAKKVLEAKGEIQLGGERRRVTVMFADIRGFTSFSEKLPPEEVVSLLNEYFDILVDVVFKYEGTLDKFMGDCIMSVFGAPFYHGDDEERAVQCALEMQNEMLSFNEKRRAENKREIDVGIGVNTGPAIAGNIGSRKRIEYTVIGDTVNTAFRIQALAQKGEIIISEGTYLELKDRLEVVSLPPVSVKGREEPVSVFKVMSYIEKKERRRYKRIHTDIPVRYKLAEKGALFSEGIANISGGGCMMKTKEKLNESDKLQLEIHLSSAQVLKNISGKVLDSRVSHDGTYKSRIEYKDVSQNIREEIVKFVYEALEKGAKEVEM